MKHDPTSQPQPLLSLGQWAFALLLLFLLLLAALGDASIPRAHAQANNPRGQAKAKNPTQARSTPPQAGKKARLAAPKKAVHKNPLHGIKQPVKGEKKGRQVQVIPIFDGRIARSADGLIDPNIRFTDATPVEIQTGVAKALDANRIPVPFVRRIVEKARRAGVPEKKLREIVVEDEDGTLVNAIVFLKEYDLRKQDTLRRRREQRNRRRFTVHEMLDELNQTQPADLARLRKTLPLDERE